MKYRHYDTTEIDGDINVPRFNWHKYYSVRNDLLKACRQFGSVGPMGERQITGSEEEPEVGEEIWPVESSSPDIFIVDDMLNQSSTYIRIELDQTFITQPFVTAVSEALKRHAGWAASIGTGKFNLILFEDSFMINAPFLSKFKWCKKIETVINFCKQ